MKRIGSGWQYVVYDLGNGRVLKKRRPIAEQLFAIVSGLIWNRSFSFTEMKQEYQRINRQADESVAFLHTLTSPEDLALFGNPLFSSDGSYTQDKVYMLTQYFKEHTLEENCIQIDRYVRFTHKLWAIGMSEVSFLFTQNAGLDASGNIVQVDFGEMTTDKQYVLEDIRAKRWRERYVYKVLPERLRAHFDQAMCREFTEENLDRYWKT